jgi:ABC-type Zn uptake system ZnuABC Zn-binding protein ZnuA
MKKLLAMLMVAGIFSLVACGPSEEEKAAAEAEAAAMVEEMFDGIEEAAEEVTEEAAVTEAPAEEATTEEAPQEEAPAE